MLSADEVRKKMPSCTPATKEEFLSAIEKRAVEAAKQGAISIWLTAKDGYKETPTAALEQALNILRAEGYRLVEDKQNGKPAMRIYWEDEPKPSEWEIQNVPRTFRELTTYVLSSAVTGAVVFGMLAYTVALSLNVFFDSSHNLYDIAMHYAVIGFFVIGLLTKINEHGIDVRKKKEAN